MRGESALLLWGMRAPYVRFDPTGPETPVIVEVPHAGLDLAPPFLEPLAAPARAIGRDADLYVDALYEDAPAEGATLLVATASRYVIDVNRSEADIGADVVEGGRADVQLQHGLVWRQTSDGDAALARRLRRDELEERLALVWRPYHEALASIVAAKQARFGVAVIIAAHSMPSVDRAARSATLLRADVVPGTRGRRSAASRFIDLVDTHAASHGWSVRHDDPYAGGFTTQHYGRPADQVHVVQIELARRLYLDEATLRPRATLPAVRAWCRTLVARMGSVAMETET